MTTTTEQNQHTSQSKSKSKSNRKTRIDILIMGPYGLGKTEVFSKAIKLLPGSTQASGQASTGLSLTAIVERMESGMTIAQGRTATGGTW